MSVARAYGAGNEMQLGSYAAFVGLFGVGLGAVLWRANRLGFMPERVRVGDSILLGVATHKLSRLVTKDWVTAPFRAPFVEYRGSAGSGEVKEKSRGTGLRKAIGDLVTCNYCSGPWIALGLVAAYLEAPRGTRTVAGILAAVTVSDWLHRGYETLGKKKDELAAAEETVRAANAAMHPTEESGSESSARISAEPSTEVLPTDGGGSAEAQTEHLETHPDDVGPGRF